MIPLGGVCLADSGHGHFAGWIAGVALSARGAVSSTRKLAAGGAAAIALILLNLA
jgi:hypothetical protein